MLCDKYSKKARLLQLRLGLEIVFAHAYWLQGEKMEKVVPLYLIPILYFTTILHYGFIKQD